MSEAILSIVVNAKGIPEANSGLDNLDKKAVKAEKSAKALTGTVGMLGGALGALGVTLGLMAVKDAADDWSDMNSRLGLTVGGAEKAAAVMERLQGVAKNTYSDINTTTESFIANAATLRELGRSTADALDYTEALNNALVVSGAKAETAASVQEALSRAMALGKLSGDNLNTVIAKGGRVTQALADEMGVSTLELRKLGQEGKITGDILYSSLTKRLEELRDEAEEMPATMGDAATAWSNAFTIIVGTVDQATGASGALGQALYDMGYQLADQANNIATAFVSMQMLIGDAVGAISGALGGMFGDFDTGSALMIAGIGLGTTAFVGLAAAIMGPVIGAFSALTVAVLANPLGLLVGAIAAVVAAAFIFRDEIAQILGFDLVDAAKTGANYLINAFVGTYDAVVAVWDDLPAAFEYIWKSGVNKVLDVMIWWAGQLEEFFKAIPGALGDAMENFPNIFANAVIGAVKLGADAVSWLVNQAIDLLNKMLSGVKWLLDKVGIGMEEIKGVDIGEGLKQLPVAAGNAAGALKRTLEGMKLDISDSAQDAGNKIGEAYANAFQVDRLGEFNNKLGETWTAAGEVANQFKNINTALDGDGGNGAGGALGDVGGKGKKGKDEKSRAADKLAREMERRLEILKEGLLTEEETVLAQYAKDLETLQWHLDNKKITEQEYLDWRAQVTREHEEEMTAIRLQGYADALGATGDMMGAMAQVVGSNNDKMLKAQKIFGAASALVSTYIGAAKALELGFPQNLAAMATVLAKGMALVGAIKSGSKASAGGGGSGSGNKHVAAPPEQKPTKSQAVEIKLHGEVFDRKGVENLLGKVQDALDDGFVLHMKVA